MALNPDIKRTYAFVMKKCDRCGGSFGPENFAQTHSIFYKDGYLPICNSCITNYLKDNNFDWRAVDKVCQWADIPFIPKEWERLKEMNDENSIFGIYANVFHSEEYEGLGWGDYYEEFKQLKEAKLLEDELPLIRDAKFDRLREKWGSNYDDEALLYLERLYEGILSTQNVNGALQIDQALKICKMSYEIDCRIRAGTDFDKILASYDKMVKTAEFVPKNVKNINDFDTMGELIKWFEKKGWKNKYYDNVTRDIVDETIKNFQSFNQRLYTNESGIGEEITKRIEALKHTQELEDSLYDTNKQYDLDEFENEGFDELIKEDFNPEI
jgi:hypothetical protein